MDISQISTILKREYPMLLLNGVTHIEPRLVCHAFKNLSYNEWFFPAHFDDEPNVPGFIQMECLVQTFIMTFLSMEEHRGKKTNFAGINNVKFKRKIIPGDRLEIEATLDTFKRGIAKGSAISFVNGEPACSAEFIVTLPDVFENFNPKNAKV